MALNKTMKIKNKSVLFAVLLAAAFLSCLSCASKKGASAKGKKAPDPVVAQDPSVPPDENAAVAPAESAEGGSTAADGVTSSAGQEAPAAAVDSGAARVSSKNARKNYTGWIDSSSRPVDASFGMVRLRSLQKKGLFNILVIGENDKSVPVLSTTNEYITTSFYLKAGKKIIKLNDDNSVRASSHKTDTGLFLSYSIDNLASVEVSLDVFASESEGDFDSLKIKAAVTNKGKKKTDMALKVVLDTVLGETDRHHFYTAEDEPVKAETLYRDFSENKWWLSKNSRASMQIIVDCAEATTPEFVALANYSTLDTQLWEPDLLMHRGFDTVLSYNNSAVEISWPVNKIAVGKSYDEIFYLGFAAGSDPSLLGYVLSGMENEAAKKKTASGKTRKDALELILASPAVKENSSEPEVISSTAAAAGTRIEQVQPNVFLLTDEQLSYEYIQQLLNRIVALEEDDPSLNRAELLQLNAELDAIIEALRKQQ